MRSFFPVLTFFLLLSVFPAVAGSVRIRSQAEFDCLGERVLSQLQTEDSVHVFLEPGLYYFGDRHLVLEGLSCPRASITVSGAGAVLVGRGTPGQTPTFDQGFVNLEDLRAFDALGPVRKAFMSFVARGCPMCPSPKRPG